MREAAQRDEIAEAARTGLSERADLAGSARAPSGGRARGEAHWLLKYT
jgi:hypothetical protein